MAPELHVEKGQELKKKEQKKVNPQAAKAYFLCSGLKDGPGQGWTQDCSPFPRIT